MWPLLAPKWFNDLVSMDVNFWRLQERLRLIEDTRTQLRSCRHRRFSVSNRKACKPTFIHRLSVLKELIEHIANVITYDNEQAPQYVLHDKRLKSFNLHWWQDQ